MGDPSTAWGKSATQWSILPNGVLIGQLASLFFFSHGSFFLVFSSSFFLHIPSKYLLLFQFKLIHGLVTSTIGK